MIRRVITIFLFFYKQWRDIRESDFWGGFIHSFMLFKYGEICKML